MEPGGDVSGRGRRLLRGRSAGLHPEIPADDALSSLATQLDPDRDASPYTGTAVVALPAGGASSASRPPAAPADPPPPVRPLFHELRPGAPPPPGGPVV